MWDGAREIFEVEIVFAFAPENRALFVLVYLPVVLVLAVIALCIFGAVSLAVWEWFGVDLWPDYGNQAGLGDWVWIFGYGVANSCSS